MYIPGHFAARESELARDIIEQHGFATVVTIDDGMPFASHLPLLLERRDDSRDVLVGHLARGNPQCRHLELGHPVLAVFAGPHAYVSPGWYQPEPDHVPTWNYVAVHVRGRPRLVAPGAATIDVVRRLTARYERGEYRVAFESEAIQRMATAIVAFDIEIDEILTKLKLSQNRSATDRDEVGRQLGASDDADARGVASWMARVRR